MNDLSTWVEVDLDGFAANLRAIRAIVGEGVRLHLVVKADAYGHGVAPIAAVAAEEGVHSLGVATLDEGAELRREGVTLPIVVLSPSLPSEASRVVRLGLTPTVGNRETALALAQAAEGAKRDLTTQIEVDTGMGRSGVPQSSLVELARVIESSQRLTLAGLFTHFPKADLAQDRVTVERQVADLKAAADGLRREGIDPGLLHAANSAGIVNYPISHLDMVRPGILAYGLSPSDSVAIPSAIQPIMRFVTRLVHIRELPEGHPISYGGDFVTPEPMRVGTAAVGYGHGYPFTLSGRGYALLRGRRVPILGRVTMDTTVFDLRGVPEAALGDEIVLFGRQRDESIRVSDVASRAGTIPYELLIGIGRRVPRVYTKVGRRVEVRTLLGSERAEGES